MVNPIGINIATEDELSEAVILKLILSFGDKFCVYNKLRRNGFGYLKANIEKFIELSKQCPTLVVTDLDRKACPIVLIQDWFNGGIVPSELVFCIAIREIEAWLLADAQGLTRLMGGKKIFVIDEPEDLPDPKRQLLMFAKSAKREVKEALLPDKGSLAPQGLGYNAALINFVNQDWSIENAQEKSPSLRRLIHKLQAI